MSKIYFDKTGTLTEGQFKLLYLTTHNQTYSREQILQFLLLMEERASHPLAQALIDGAKNEEIKVPESFFVQDHTFLPGEGVLGIVNGHQVYVGNARLFTRLNLLVGFSDDQLKTISEWEVTGGTTGFISCRK